MGSTTPIASFSDPGLPIVGTVDLIIDSEPLWLFQTNAYVVATGRGGPAIVVDAPPDPVGVGELLARHDLTPVAVLVSHGHVDHAAGIDAVARPGITAYLHPADVDMARHPGEQLRALMGGAFEAAGATVHAPLEALEGGTTLVIADLMIDVLHTPGHTPGHCCFHLRDHGVLFSGDHLFAGSIGRTDLPGGSYPTLMASMEREIIPLDPDTSVLPGHGPATTLAVERRHNPFLQEFL
jgi:glyoxylase-like metal-dependent hydrolase (beta-lactamase superfamily II)